MTGSVRTCLSVTALLLIGSMARAQRDATAEQLERARTAYVKENFADAATAYEEAAGRLSDPLPALSPLLRCQIWTEDYSKAIDTAVKINHRRLTLAPPSNWLAKSWRMFTKAAVREKAIDHTKAGRYEQAIALYRGLLELEPRNRGILRDLEWVLWRTQRYPEAVDIAAHAAALRPKEAQSWNVLGKVFLASKEREDALRAYRKSLVIDPRQPLVEQTIGKLYVDMRDFETASRFLGNLQKMDPSGAGTYPNLARAQFYQGHYAASAQSWAKAVELFPDNVDYKVARAQALYFSGHISEALAELRKISDETGNRQAMDFLTNDALATGQLTRAESLLQETPGDPQPEDPQLLKIATMYKDMNRPAKSMSVVDKDLSVNPRNVSAILFKADYYLQQERYAEAEKAYRHAQRISPWSTRAWTGLAEARFGAGRPLSAAMAIRQAQKLDPTDPYLRFQAGRYIYENGNDEGSARTLNGRGGADSDTVVPVLLYHGLTPFRRDPMLAYPMHLTTARFEEHMRALKKAGFTPVTAEQVTAWLARERELPPKPILITFDDARLDSFRQADPILEKYGFKATMFVAIVNIEEQMAPAYAPWRQIEQYARTGRWEIESHGDLAHASIPIDARGRRGFYLINRQWLEKDRRLETMDEWRERVLQDHARSRRKIEDHIGRAPHAYAFPAGTYGQMDTSNSPEAVPLNLSAVRRYFKAAYHQDRYGMNVRDRDPMLLTRVEAHQDWTGEQLILHLQSQNPTALRARQMMHQAAWEGKSRAARRWLEEMRQQGFSEPVLLAEESRMKTSQGRLIEGKELISRAAQTGDPDPDIPKIAASVAQASRTLWTPELEIMSDNQNRTNVLFQQAGLWHLGNQQWSLFHRLGTFHDQVTVVDHGIGLGWAHPLGDFHWVSLRTMGHLLSAGAPNQLTLGGAVASEWTPKLGTELAVERDGIETAPALVAGITEKVIRAQIRGGDGERWRGSLQGRRADLSDDNRRLTFNAETAYNPISWLNGWLVYHFTFDDMQNLRPQYYSPRHNVENQIGLAYGQRLGRWQWDFRYLPGFGSETGTETMFIQNLETSLQFRWSEDTKLAASFALNTTPTYRRGTYGLNLVHRF